MAAGKKCVAKFNYKANDGEELGIVKGEMLQVIDDKGTWWKVRNTGGDEGLVPSNYIEVVAGPVSTAGQISSTSARTNLQHNEPPNQYQQPDLMMNMPRNGPSLNIRAIAKFKYNSTREDELSLNKGDEVIVMEKEADGWWRGRCGTKIGWFPFNYVEETPVPAASQDTSQPPPGKAFICGVIALYSFNSGNPEELPFEKGDLLDIIDQPPDDPDWWEARKANGNTGLVPRNYVEVVHDAEPVFGKTGSSSVAKAPWAAKAGAAVARTAAPFSREEWFYGKIARREAESLLNSNANNGEFIIRESETKVSFNWNNIHNALL